MSFITINVINPAEELQAFPLNQHIYLRSSTSLETSLIENNLVLIREIDEQGALRASDIYNSNIGHIKNTYSTVPLAVSQEKQQDGSYLIKCDPTSPLLPASKYLLFLDKELSSEFISVVKTLSKGPSQLELLSVNSDINNDVIYKLKVISEPALTQTANIVKFQLYVDDTPSKTFTVNAKTVKNRIEFAGISLQVLDTAYALGEEFEILHEGSRLKLEENFVVPILTSVSTSVKPLEGVEPSSSVSYEDILDYYKEADKSSIEGNLSLDRSKHGWEKEEFSIQYLDETSFILHLNQLTTNMLDLNNISYRQFPAYNRSDLKSLDKYDPKLKYKLVPEILDDKTVLFIIEPEGGQGGLVP